MIGNEKRRLSFDFAGAKCECFFLFVCFLLTDAGRLAGPTTTTRVAATHWAPARRRRRCRGARTRRWCRAVRTSRRASPSSPRRNASATSHRPRSSSNTSSPRLLLLLLLLSLSRVWGSCRRIELETIDFLISERQLGTPNNRKLMGNRYEAYIFENEARDANELLIWSNKIDSLHERMKKIVWYPTSIGFHPGFFSRKLFLICRWFCDYFLCVFRAQMEIKEEEEEANGALAASAQSPAFPTPVTPSPRSPAAFPPASRFFPQHFQAKTSCANYPPWSASSLLLSPAHSLHSSSQEELTQCRQYKSQVDIQMTIFPPQKTSMKWFLSSIDHQSILNSRPKIWPLWKETNRNFVFR